MRLTQKELDLIGSKVIMTHSERQKFLKTSGLAKIFGVDHLLPEVDKLDFKPLAEEEFNLIPYLNEEELKRLGND